MTVDRSETVVPRRLTRWLPPALVALVTIIMLFWTWHHCPGPIVDFGREIYIPWRITEGEVLYRDLNYFNGPFSPYFNAMVFEIFGVSLRNLKLANATITILVALLVYHLIRQLSDTLTATVAGIAFAALFACAHVVDMANFNFLTPYSHDLTHGIALSLAMLACLSKAAALSSVVWGGFAGVAFGCVLLTKAEVALAASAGAAVMLASMFIWGHGMHERLPIRVVAVFGVVALLVVLIAVVLLSPAMPLSMTLSSSAGAWMWMGDERIRQLRFFQWVLGTDELGPNIARMVAWLGRYALLFVPAVAIGLALRGRAETSGRRTIPWVAAVVLAAVMTFWWSSIPWRGALRPLPIVLGVLIVMGISAMTTRPSISVMLALGLAVFAEALLAKVFFNVRPFHYGFALAMPGTMLLIVMLVWWIPNWVDRVGGFGWFPRAIALAALGVMVGGQVYLTGRVIAKRNFTVGAGSDRFLVDARGPAINEALDELRRHVRAGDTLVVLPEGAMLNYLLRVPSPLRWQNFLPSEMMMYSQDAMLDAMKQRRATFVAIVQRDALQFGARFFGEDYGRDIATWLQQNYDILASAGTYPFQESKFGILILRRRDSK